MSPLKQRLLAATLALSATGIAFIKAEEGTENKVYLDIIGIPTVCTGHTGPDVKVGGSRTDAECDELLRKDSSVAQRAVKRLVKVPVTQDQYDVLVSWTFNLGEGNLAASTMLKRINAGQCVEAGKEMLRWDRADGKPSKGLKARRQREAAKWTADCPT